MADNTPIIAQCTPSGNGAIALLRICGTNVRQLCNAFCTIPGKSIDVVASHTIHYGSVVDDKGATIDTVLFFVMDGPRSFTGQDTIEISCHNNPFLIEKIIEQAIKAGARTAQNGEFTKRALLNGKLDLVQAESINELIHATTHESLKRSLAQVEGSLSNWIAQLEEQLLKALCLSNASFEFLDEEDMEFGIQINGIIAETHAKVARLLNTYDSQKQIREGFRIALIGSVNAGKSSLFNALANEQRAIVTAQAGTTRDVIEAPIIHNGNYWTIIDTAGLRATTDVIEKEGIDRSYLQAEKADLILLVYDTSTTMSQITFQQYKALHENYKDKVIVVANKTDLKKAQTPLAPNEIAVSHQANSAQKKLLPAIARHIKQLTADSASPFLINKRHTHLLKEIGDKLIHIQAMIEQDNPYELISHELQETLGTLSQLTGKSVSEQALDGVFKQFCVGK